jgi:hypothetical protein
VIPPHGREVSQPAFDRKPANPAAQPITLIDQFIGWWTGLPLGRERRLLGASTPQAGATGIFGDFRELGTIDEVKLSGGRQNHHKM